MNARDFGRLLEAFSDLLSDAGATEQARAWRAAVPMFQAKPSATLKEVFSVISKLDVPIEAGPIRTETLIQLWPSMERYLCACAKKQIVDDARGFINALSPFARSSLTDLSGVISSRLSSGGERGRKTESGNIVHAYLGRLEEALGKEKEFLEVFNSLKSDSALRAPDAKQLAREFTKQRATSKADAYNRIWERHASLVGAGARAKSTGGRTAA